MNRRWLEEKLVAVLVAVLFCTATRPAIGAECGHWGYLGDSVGGGQGYTRLVPPNQDVVTTVDELEAALAEAQTNPGTTIYVDDCAVISLTGRRDLQLPAGTTLASGRGNPGSSCPEGALLFTDEMYETPGDDKQVFSLFKVTGPGVRITGLRLRGHDTEIRDEAYSHLLARGIDVRGHDDLEVDNCELSGWSHAAVFLQNSRGNHIHHNYIHHNRRSGLGYGVVLIRAADALVEANVFNANRHAISGSGERDQSYEARYNLVLPSTVSAVFDMHGEKENPASEDVADSPYAGNRIAVHHNTFLSTSYPAVIIRGTPFDSATIERNWFAQGEACDAVWQKIYEGRHPDGRLSAPICPLSVFTIRDNCYDFEGWYLSDGGRKSWFPVAASRVGRASLAVGDFDADGKEDLFYGDGSRWFAAHGGRAGWHPLGFGSWEPLAYSGLQAPDLAFGQFLGDDRTDVFRGNGQRWFASDAGLGGWVPLAHSGHLPSALAFGDFVGDGRTDPLRNSQGRWHASDGGVGSWQPLAASSLSPPVLRFGDFIGDDRTDVFRTTNGQWYLSRSATETWQAAAASDYALDQLAVCDFDGDGKDDIFASTGSEWLFSKSAQASWEKLATSGYPVSELIFGDFTGDGVCDVLRTGRP